MLGFLLIQGVIVSKKIQKETIRIPEKENKSDKNFSLKPSLSRFFKDGIPLISKEIKAK
jgi:hypothetical protein